MRRRKSKDTGKGMRTNYLLAIIFMLAFSLWVFSVPDVHESVPSESSELAYTSKTESKAITGYAYTTNNPPTGYLDAAYCTYAGGWAKDPDTDNPIAVHFYFDGIGAFGTVAKFHRPDLAKAGIGNGYHAFHYIYPKEVLEIICDGRTHNVAAHGIDDRHDPQYHRELGSSPKTIRSCGYFKENGAKYACCDSDSKVLDAYGNCVDPSATCQNDGTKGGVCDSSCSGSSVACHGKKPGDSIASCTKGGKSYVLDKCNSNCLPVDRATEICESSYGCSSDPGCDGETPGTGSCSSDCKYSTSTTSYYRKGIMYEKGGHNQITNQSDRANCPTARYCVYGRRCYAQGTTKDVDGDGDKEYCGSSQRWFEVDSYGKELSDYPGSRFSSLCDKLVGSGRWNIGGEAVSPKNYAAGWDHCCGDDSGEYLITYSGKKACCDSYGDILNSSGNCVEPSGPQPANKPPTGYLDAAYCTYAGGWAKDPDTDNPIAVKIYFGSGSEQIVKDVVAGIYRADLKKAGIGNGIHAFHYVYERDVLEKICNGGRYVVWAEAINDRPGKNTEINDSAMSINSCGYFRTNNNNDYACCPSNSQILAADGKCVEQSVASCTDWDNGKKYGTKSYVEYNGATYSDRCHSTDEVKEFYCQNNVKKYIIYDCGNDSKTCYDGRCAEPQCTGTVPGNSEICTDDDKDLHNNVRRTLAEKCTSQRKCEYVCREGYKKDGDACEKEDGISGQSSGGSWGKCSDVCLGGDPKDPNCNAACMEKCKETTAIYERGYVSGCDSHCSCESDCNRRCQGDDTEPGAECPESVCLDKTGTFEKCLSFCDKQRRNTLNTGDVRCENCDCSGECSGLPEEGAAGDCYKSGLGDYDKCFNACNSKENCRHDLGDGSQVTQGYYCERKCRGEYPETVPSECEYPYNNYWGTNSYTSCVQKCYSVDSEKCNGKLDSEKGCTNICMALSCHRNCKKKIGDKCGGDKGECSKDQVTIEWHECSRTLSDCGKDCERDEKCASSTGPVSGQCPDGKKECCVPSFDYNAFSGCVQISYMCKDVDSKDNCEGVGALIVTAEDVCCKWIVVGDDSCSKPESMGKTLSTTSGQTIICCDENNPCPEGYKCNLETNECEKEPGDGGIGMCITDNDCSSGKICQNGECVSVDCGVTGCPPGQRCDYVTQECVDDGECPPTAECRTDYDCSSDEVCHDCRCTGGTVDVCICEKSFVPGCGAGGCSSNSMSYQITCNPSGCRWDDGMTGCEYDSYCENNLGDDDDDGGGGGGGDVFPGDDDDDDDGGGGGGGGGGGDGGCFLAGTDVPMADGTSKDIEDVEVGDAVKSYDMATGKVSSGRVAMLFHHEPEDMKYDYYLVINGHLEITPEHRVFTNKGILHAGDLSEGMMWMNEEGGLTRVDSSRKVYERVLTYNFEVEGYRTYFAEGLLVHNGKSEFAECFSSLSSFNMMFAAFYCSALYL